MASKTTNRFSPEVRDTRRSAGFRAREGSSLAVGDGDFDCLEDRLHGAVAQ